MDKQEVFRRGRRFLDLHGLSDWSITIDRRPTNRHGECRRDRREIGVSQCFIDDVIDTEEMGFRQQARERLDDLLLHEVAHALAPAQCGHRKAWKQKYAELLWSHFPDVNVGRLLSRCQYCREHVDELIEHAKAQAVKRITWAKSKAALRRVSREREKLGLPVIEWEDPQNIGRLRKLALEAAAGDLVRFAWHSLHHFEVVNRGSSSITKKAKCPA